MNAVDAASKVCTKGNDGDIDELFVNALGMRWLLLDEISTLSPYLLGLLDAYLKTRLLSTSLCKISRKTTTLWR